MLRDGGSVVAPDLVNGDFFTAAGPEKLWVARIHSKTDEGFLDPSRFCLRTKLAVVDALQVALWCRKPLPVLIRSSDQGVHSTRPYPLAGD